MFDDYDMEVWPEAPKDLPLDTRERALNHLLSWTGAVGDPAFVQEIFPKKLPYLIERPTMGTGLLYEHLPLGVGEKHFVAIEFDQVYNTLRACTVWRNFETGEQKDNHNVLQRIALSLHHSGKVEFVMTYGGRKQEKCSFDGACDNNDYDPTALRTAFLADKSNVFAKKDLLTGVSAAAKKSTEL